MAQERIACRNCSIVDFYAERERYRCGYCKSVDTNYSHGLWAHYLTHEDYQDLIDRGWRRSGRYCYKPIMHVTCCPMYTIKCSALDFKLSKSQKKVLKRMHRFLAFGDVKTSEGSTGEGSEASEDPVDVSDVIDIPDLQEKSQEAEKNADTARIASVDPSLTGRIGSMLMTLTDTLTDTLTGSSRDNSETEPNEKKKARSVSEDSEPKKIVQPGKGSDSNRPPCKKAKLVRLEKKKEKLMKKGLSADQVEEALTKNKKPPPQAKSLEDFLSEPLPENPAHKLEMRLVRSSPPSVEFEQSSKQAHEVYQKYQMAIHGDSAEKCSFRQFSRFLVSSPLQCIKPSICPPHGFGSFHMQYWLDGRLIAVGVIDILPKCVSSVYFYYDPDFSHLSLGTYASLRELHLTRSIQKNVPDLKYYYMGFYIHTCPKMRYKSAYFPSFLLCPETYTWHPVEKCKVKLDANRYSRLEDDDSVVDSDGDPIIKEILVVSKNRAMPYDVFHALHPDPVDLDETRQYANLVGMKCARKMVLVKQ